MVLWQFFSHQWKVAWVSRGDDGVQDYRRGLVGPVLAWWQCRCGHEVVDRRGIWGRNSGRWVLWQLWTRWESGHLVWVVGGVQVEFGCLRDRFHLDARILVVEE